MSFDIDLVGTLTCYAALALIAAAVGRVSKRRREQGRR